MKPWLKNYPANISHEIETNRYGSVIELFEETSQAFQDKTAYSSFETTLSFNQLDTLSTNFAAYLQNRLLIKKADRIALMCPNGLPFVVAMWGIIKCGAVQVNVNPLYTPRELKHQLNDALVDSIVIFSGSTPILAEIIEQSPVKNVIIVKADDLLDKGLPDGGIDQRLQATMSFTDILHAGQSMLFKQPLIGHSDLIFLQYTGGTTGQPKGAMLTHENIIANVLQFQQFTKNHLHYGNELVITAIPMYHIFALVVNGISFFSLGAGNVLIANPRDMPSFVKSWSKQKITAITGVNSLYNGLLHTPGFDLLDFSMLKLSLGGGSAVQQAVSDKWQMVTGKRIEEGYGLSETSPVLTLNLDRGEGKQYITGIGVPLPSTDISIRDDQGKEVSDGEEGELCAKGPQVMAGYWNNSEATAQTMTADGYFKTGDIAQLDEFGYFHIVDRKKDMVLVSGFNVYPNEIEAEIAKIPGILECACIGVADQSTGEAVKVFVVKSTPEITAADVITFCRARLAGYKVPKQIQFIDEIPKSSVGKVLRRTLRDYN